MAETGSSSTACQSVKSRKGVRPDLLDTVTDGNGNFTTFNYAPLTDSSVYQKYSDAVFPQQDFQAGMQVVASIESSTGNGDTYVIDYSYAGAQLNVQGRGLSGFDTRTVIDNRNGNKVIETYLRESMPAPIGLRSTDHIVNRLLRKLRDANDPVEFDKAIKVIDELSQVDGSPESVLAEGRRICSRHGLQTEPFDELEALFDRLSGTIPPEALVTLDLGLWLMPARHQSRAKASSRCRT